MTAVFIANHHEAQSAAKNLFSLLSKSVPCALCGFGCYDFLQSEPEIFIVACREGAKIRAVHSISLLLSGCTDSFLPPENSAVLTFGALPRALQRGNELQLISCGLGGRNSLTLSSLSTQKAMLSVQRTITTLDGAAIDIGEYPILFENADRTALIAAAAISLLHFGPGRPLNFL